MSARRRGRTIGAVLHQLQPDFPDLSISKIRYLETEGLLTPERTPSGYRLYAASDVERLRYILTAQRDWFWPLKVIREALDALERGLTPGTQLTGGSGVGATERNDPGAADARPVVPPAVPDPDLPTPGAFTASDTLRLTESELAGAAGLSTDLLGSLRTYGLLRPDATGHYDRAALSVATAAAALAAYGVEARHLRQFRTAAEREVGLVQQIVTPLTSRTGAADPTGEVLHHCLALHVALVKAELRRG